VLKNRLCSSTFLLFMAFATQASAAHWKLISTSDATIPSSITSDSTVSRGMRVAVTATIPSSPTMIYGSGSFQFFGESDSYNTSFLANYPLTQDYHGYVHAYYTYKYQWVSDNAGDVPPDPNQDLQLSGYSLTRCPQIADYQFAGFGGPNTIGMLSWSVWFNSNIHVFSPTWPSFGHSITAPAWPASTDSPVAMVGGSLYFITPEILGGGPVTIDPSGNTIITVSVLNVQQLNESTPIFPNSPTAVLEGWNIYGSTTRYAGGSQINGLPIHN